MNPELAMDEPVLIQRMARVQQEWLQHVRDGYDHGQSVLEKDEWPATYQELERALCLIDGLHSPSNELPKRPGKSLPARPSNHPEWKEWIDRWCEYVNASDKGASACWDNNKRKLEDAGFKGWEEFRTIHKQYRARPKK